VTQNCSNAGEQPYASQPLAFEAAQASRRKVSTTQERAALDA